MNEVQDIDKLELLANGINELVDVGEAVFKDGKIDLMDISELGALSKAAMKIVEAVKAHKEMLKEAKDIDPAEAVKIVQVLLARK